MRICIPTLLCLLILLASLDISHQCEEDEKAALLSFKSFLTDPLGRLSSWRGQNCCDWAGVHCSNSSQVVAVDLRNPWPDSISRGVNSQLIQDQSSNSTSIKGTISPSLFTLRHLEYLDLSYNNFQLSRVPPQLSSLKNLAYLNFSNSNFSDSVSTQLANLSSLQSLDLSCSFQINDFSSASYNLSSSRASMNSRISYGFGGYVTMKSLNWLRGMANLKELRLNGVDLSVVSSESNWAEPISFLYDLRRLSLSNCQISGPIPMNQFLNLTRLSSLQMGFNFFASPIPTEIANFSSLAILDLTNSNIKGSLTSLPPLEEIYLDNNDNLTIDMDLIFSVPRPHLQKLSIMYTNTFGPIPSSISNASSLVYFDASSNSIQGSIPNSFTNLSNLQYLDLSFNNITGHLPTSIDGLQSLQVLFMSMNYLEGPIPESICKISSLEGIHFGSNNLNGTIPNCISEIPNLSILYVGINNMEGTVTSILSLLNSPPYALGLSFSGLTVQSVSGLFPSNFQPYMLGLGSCKLSGKIPEFISNLTQVVFLDLSNNSLTGSIPSWLFKLPKLGYLDLSYNHFQGTLPPSVQLHLTFPTSVLRLSNNNLRGPIPYLTQPIDVIDLFWNNFSGEITAQVGEGLAKTRSISLSENKLSGLIPHTLCQPNHSLLKSLDLSKNQLTGSVPSNLGNCKSLIFLNLGTNNLTGRPPNELSQVKSLKSLQLHENQFEGSFPNFIKHLQDIEVLILGNNIFQGEIPAFVGELRSLRLIVLKSNNFNGSIPMQITHLRNLQFLDFSHNKLSGPIPDQLIHLETMIQRHTQGFLVGYIVSLVYNGVGLDIATKGNVHEVNNVFSYLTGIDLSSNFLQGKIPTDFGLLQGLYMLNLSRNHLSGEIPVSFGDMRSLESLDLSFNGLTGGIPATLTNLDFLTYLNLSHNGLGGRIPVGEHFDTLSGDGGSAYVGNSRLCGPQVNKSCNGGPDEVGDVAEDDDMAWVDTWLFFGFVGQGYVFGMCGLFGILAVKRVRWWDKYWTSVDETASRIIEWTAEMRSSS